MKKTIILLLFIIVTQILYGQNNYCKESIVVHTDREEYIAGEKVWFKIIGLNLNKSTFDNFSKIAYIEIISPNGFSISRKKIPLVIDKGEGELQLSDTLSSGIYKILAYTNWMKNDSPSEFYTSNILIYNPGKAFTRNKHKPQVMNIEISQGGNELIPGLNNSIYYRLNGGFNESSTIFIKNSNDSILEEVKLEKSYGEIRFHPLANESYIITYKSLDTIINISLPNSKNEGLLFNLEEIKDEYIEFVIQSTDVYRSLLNKVSYTLNNSKARSIIELERTTSISVLKDSLINGKNIITFCKLDGSVLWQREFYTESNSFAVDLEGITSGYFEKRKLNSLYLSAENIPCVFDSLDLSISIRKTFDTNTSNNKLLKNDFLSINRSNNELLFDDNVANKMDEKFYPEYKGALISGKILKSNGKPLIDNDIFLSYPDSIVQVNISKTNNTGEFNFFIRPDKSVRDIVINANNHSKDLTILVSNNYLNEYSFIDQTLVDDFNEDYDSFLDDLYTNYRINKLYNTRISKVKSNFKDKYRCYSFYQKADKIFNLDDYVELDSIREYFYEIIQEVRIITPKTNPQFRVIDNRSNMLFSGDPVLFIDGVYVENARMILDLNPIDCKRIEVIQQPILLKNRVYYGLIAVFTKGYNLKDVDLPSNTSRIEYNVFDTSEEFEFLYEQKQELPIFRNTLYWDPNVSVSKNSVKEIEFFTGDDNSWYEIVIRGITKSGHKIYTSKIFKVGTPE